MIPFFNKRVVLQSLPLNSIFLGYLLNLNTLFNTSWPSDKEELYERKFSFHHYQKSSYKFTKKIVQHKIKIFQYEELVNILLFKRSTKKTSFFNCSFKEKGSTFLRNYFNFFHRKKLVRVSSFKNLSYSMFAIKKRKGVLLFLVLSKNIKMCS